MQLRRVGMLLAAVVAAPAIAGQNVPGGAAAPDTGSGQRAPQASTATRAPAAGSQAASAPAQYYVDLNSASRKQLMTLPGIGAEEAARIIANRPYLSKTDLVNKNVLPMGPFLSLRHLVVAMPTKVSKGRS